MDMKYLHIDKTYDNIWIGRQRRKQKHWVAAENLKMDFYTYDEEKKFFVTILYRLTQENYKLFLTGESRDIKKFWV